MTDLRSTLRALCPRPVLLSIRRLLASWKSRNFSDPVSVQRALAHDYPEWQARVNDVVSCPDNQEIPRVFSAGSVRGGWVVMHNGIEVGGLTYYGGQALSMLVQNRGVHEPQQERVFMEVLPYIATGSAMLELGAYWAFYSIWFAITVPQARSFIIEPRPISMMAAKTNFRRAGKLVTFEQAYVGEPTSRSDDGTPFITVDDFCSRHALSRLGVLHADIQGSELDMLNSAEKMIDAGAVDYVFISTHSQTLHYACLSWLQIHGYLIVASADLEQTFEYDGLIVAKSPRADGPSQVVISRKTLSPPTAAIDSESPRQ